MVSVVFLISFHFPQFSPHSPLSPPLNLEGVRSQRRKVFKPPKTEIASRVMNAHSPQNQGESAMTIIIKNRRALSVLCLPSE